MCACSQLKIYSLTFEFSSLADTRHLRKLLLQPTNLLISQQTHPYNRSLLMRLCSPPCSEDFPHLTASMLQWHAVLHDLIDS